MSNVYDVIPFYAIHDYELSLVKCQLCVIPYNIETGRGFHVAMCLLADQCQPVCLM